MGGFGGLAPPPDDTTGDDNDDTRKNRNMEVEKYKTLFRAGIPNERQFVLGYCNRTSTAFPSYEKWTFLLAFSFFRIGAILQVVRVGVY